MTNSNTAVREALANAISGDPMPSFQSVEASQMMQTVRDFVGNATTHDTAMLGSYALRLLVDRLMSNAVAERESAMLVDKLRGL